MDATYSKSAGAAAWVFFIALLLALIFGGLHAVGLMRIAFLVSYLTRHGLAVFAWYRLVLAGLLIALHLA